MKKQFRKWFVLIVNMEYQYVCTSFSELFPPDNRPRVTSWPVQLTNTFLSVPAEHPVAWYHTRRCQTHFLNLQLWFKTVLSFWWGPLSPTRITSGSNLEGQKVEYLITYSGGKFELSPPPMHNKLNFKRFLLWFPVTTRISCNWCWRIF